MPAAKSSQHPDVPDKRQSVGQFYPGSLRRPTGRAETQQTAWLGKTLPCVQALALFQSRPSRMEVTCCRTVAGSEMLSRIRALLAPLYVHQLQG